MGGSAEVDSKGGGDKQVQLPVRLDDETMAALHQEGELMGERTDEFRRSKLALWPERSALLAAIGQLHANHSGQPDC